MGDLQIGGTNYYLDPAFKVSEPITNVINLTSAMGFSSNTLMSAAGGTDTGNYVTNLNEANLRSTLTGYTTNLLNYLQNNYPNASMQQILGGLANRSGDQHDIKPVSIVLPIHFDRRHAVSGTVAWNYEPTNLDGEPEHHFCRTRTINGWCRNCKGSDCR